MQSRTLNHCCTPEVLDIIFEVFKTAIFSRSFLIATKWECTRNFNRNQIGVHSYIKLALGVHSHLVPIRNECTPMWSLSLQRMHSDMVLFAFWSALPLGPHHFQKCTPKLSPLKSPRRINKDCFGFTSSE